LYGEVTVTAPAVTYSRLENRVKTAPPLLGEHTIEVLKKELDMDDSHLDELKEEKVIYF